MVYGIFFFIKNLMRLGKNWEIATAMWLIVQGAMKPEQQLRLNQAHAGIETANMRNKIICQIKYVTVSKNGNIGLL